MAENASVDNTLMQVDADPVDADPVDVEPAGTEHEINLNVPFDPLDRTHRLTPPTGLWDRIGRATLDWLERVVARHSLFPDKPTYDTALFPWVADVERAWPKVRAELDAVMPRREQMPAFQDILKEVELIQRDDQWKTFFLSGIGMDCSENARHCPETMRVLRMIPNAKTAFFSILSPRKHIPAHRGAYNGLLRLHLGLQVPEPNHKVRLRIGNQIRHWHEGEAMIFDDTFDHEVWNDTDHYRVVLFVDFARPMHQPWQWLNERFLSFGVLAPFLREADAKQKKWEKAFYAGDRAGDKNGTA
jgi:aspartyl/asparaginyl beta-hydroxylase (cupin superfamily)